MNLREVSLGRVIQWFKTMTTNEHIRRVKLDHWKSFPKHLWQRNYWEHVIRNEDALHAVRRYIAQNPDCRELDYYNPNADRSSKDKRPSPG